MRTNHCTRLTHRIAIKSLLLAVLATTITPAVGQVDADHPLAYAKQVQSYTTLADGHRAEQAGQFGLAYDRYRAAAREANKFAQFRVGLMYLDDGKPVAHDPARAWAWIELSAERGYVDFREISQVLWQALGPDLQQTALEILEDELRPSFGDAVAVPRVASEMRRKRKRVTGSRVGSVGSLKIVDLDSIPPGPGSTFSFAVLNDAWSFYLPEKWDFEQIVAYETKLYGSQGGRAILRDQPTADE